MTDHARLTDLLRRFAGTLVGEYELEEVLELLGEEVAGILGVAGAGAMVADEGGDLHFVAASDEPLARLEALQIELGEGPCLLAYLENATVVASDLSDDDRFPKFGPRAVEAGMRAVYSFPMHVMGVSVGALNVFTAHAGELSEEAVGLGQTFADVATIYVLHDRDLAERDELTSGLRKALESRIVVEQAKGYLAAKTQMEPDPAFELLRRHARSNNLKAREVARAVLRGELTVSDLTGS